MVDERMLKQGRAPVVIPEETEKALHGPGINPEVAPEVTASAGPTGCSAFRMMPPRLSPRYLVR
jgi:hypothetical protein